MTATLDLVSYMISYLFWKYLFKIVTITLKLILWDVRDFLNEEKLNFNLRRIRMFIIIETSHVNWVML
jgi:hypothetical protein